MSSPSRLPHAQGKIQRLVQWLVTNSLLFPYQPPFPLSCCHAEHPIGQALCSLGEAEVGAASLLDLLLVSRMWLR